MSFTGFIDTLGSRKRISRTCLLGVTVICLNCLPVSLWGLSPTKRLFSEDFECVRKGCLSMPERVEVIPDDFLDTENGAWGITGKGVIPRRGVEEEVDVIFDETMAEEEALRVDTLLRSLQKEADVFLVEDFRKGQKISLEEAIYLALRDNEGVGFNNSPTEVAGNLAEGITTAFLAREVQKQTLLAFLETWTPVITLSNIAVNYARSYNRTGPYTTNVTLPAPSLNVVQKLKTGGNISFSWINTYNYTQVSGQSRNTSATTTVGLSFSQPLLQGAGFEIATVPLITAYLNDEISIYALQANVIQNITATIGDYRAYMQAIDTFEIQKRALYKARDDLGHIKILVEAGRRAKSDIIETQRRLAAQEFALQDNRNTVDAARIAFLRRINMDTGTNLVPENLDVLEIEPEDLPTIEELMNIALVNNPDYLTNVLQLRIAELNYMVARNNTLWALTLNGGISSGSGTYSSLGRSNEKAWDFRNRAVNVGLTLNIPINLVEARKANLLSAKVALRSAQINLRKREQGLIASIKNSVRTLKKDIIQIKLAKITTVLSKKRVVQKRLEIEAGQSSSFELTGVQDDLISAEMSEVTTEVSFMNDLAALDVFLGTTLDSWRINLNRRTENIPKVAATLFGKINTEESLKPVK